MPAGVQITRRDVDHLDEVLTPEALAFVADLHRTFDARRRKLLGARGERQAGFDAGELPRFLPETASIREDGSWRVASAPADLEDRREITGPVEPKMMINALNRRARLHGRLRGRALPHLGQRRHRAVGGVGGRPPPAHLPDRREGVRAQALDRHARHPTAWLAPRRGPHPRRCAPISASLFDFGLAFFHNAREQLDRGSGPYFYLPKLESHLEARLWNDVFTAAQIGSVSRTARSAPPC